MCVASDQGYITKVTFDQICQQADKTSKMVSGLITYLRDNEARFKRNKPDKPNKPEKPEKREKPEKLNQPNKPYSE
jgi:hypothetical protein